MGQGPDKKGNQQVTRPYCEKQKWHLSASVYQRTLQKTFMILYNNHQDQSCNTKKNVPWQTK